MATSGRFIAGEVVVVNFPFTNLEGSKSRPALVLGDSDYSDDYILCEITSKNYDNRLAIELRQNDFNAGGLHLDCFIRPLVIFTLEKTLIKKSVGIVRNDILRQTVKESSEYLISISEQPNN